MVSRLLIIAGAVLFLVGLFQGLAVDFVVNPRMALSAHLTAVQSGTAIMVAGLVAGHAQFPARWHLIMQWSIALGMWVLWWGITLASLIGASEALPMAGEGYAASPRGELLVTATIVAGSVGTILGWGLLVTGLVRR